MKGFVKLTVGVSRIEYVDSLGSSMIALPGLGSYRFATKGNLIRAYFMPLRQKHKLALALVDNDAIYADTGPL